ncbi:MAG: DUF4215 domain-containing protein [Myxococcales bacterium]|jgi:cysteine-rich repeat protein
MRTLKNLALFAAACMLALSACGDDEEKKDPPKVEICNNSVDDDGDGKADCEDSDCSNDAACKVKAEICDNAADDDGDGKVDCDDSDCASTANCQPKVEICNNGTDDDDDGKVDCDDSDCANAANCKTTAEVCDNNIDDDSDGDVDCDDSDCADAANCQAKVEICDNNIDDDDDGKADCEDSDCAAETHCQAPQCQDGETECGEDCCGGGETCQDSVCVGEIVGDCTLASSYGALTVSGPIDIGEGGSYMAMQSELPSADGTVDLLSLELYPGFGSMTNGILPGTYTIEGDDLNYGTCGICVRLIGNLTATSADAEYYITGGTVVIDQVEGEFQATLTDATFVEVTIDGGTYMSTPVPGGCTSAIDSVAFIGTIPAACDPLAPVCAEGEGCYFDGAGFTCAPAGTVEAGQPCTSTGQCVPGAECFNPGVCLALCDPAATPSTCTAPLSCNDLGDGLGNCLPPPEDCSTPGDEDLDGLSDCDDPDCTGEAACLAIVCQNATALSGLTASGDTSTGTAAFPRGSCRAASGKELLYTVSVGNAGEVGQLRITVDSDFDAVVYAQATCGDSDTELACTDDEIRDPEVLVIDDYQGGTEFTLIVDGYGSGTQGAFTISIEYLVPECGNGIIEPGETCEDDDGATPEAGDGCSETCQVEQGYVCSEVGVACRQIICGDSIKDEGEACDDGNGDAGDGCSDTCQVETGYVCPNVGAACREIVCGDGFQDEGEACDDSNTDDGDGCSSTCQIELTEVEPNDDTATANAYSDPFTAQITANDVDYISIELTEARALIIEVQDLGDGACAAGDLDSRLELFDSTGTSIASNDDIDLWGGNWCSLIDLPSVPAGTYYVKVDSWSATATFLYRLVITASEPEACGFDADLGTVTPLESSALTDGSWVVGEYVLNSDSDELMIEMYPGDGVFASGLATGTFTLAGDDLQYRTCGLCVRLRDRRGTYYMATGGEVTLSSISGNLTGSLSNVTFEEVTIAQDYTSTPVVDGCQSVLTSMAFDDVIEDY